MTHPEMTLRDYFAGVAMKAAINAYYGPSMDNQVFAKEIARLGYQMADAMMEARKG
jgi:hypothetical protein